MDIVGFFLSVATPIELKAWGNDAVIAGLAVEVIVLIAFKSGRIEKSLFVFACCVIAVGVWMERIGDDAINGPRELKPAQEVEVAKKISLFKGQQFFGEVGNPISDARILWATIAKALQDGGWKLTPEQSSTGDPPAADVLDSPQGVAVFVKRGDEATVPAAAALIRALQAAGLKSTAGAYSDKSNISSGTIKISIGARPPGE